mmetsp:Transcript_14940/g.53796  ORF Transcript_14940/g.53796 Transcript_14940/m.53796 type:complete len:320 (-) Transcript_14940:564-1523(-)
MHDPVRAVRARHVSVRRHVPVRRLASAEGVDVRVAPHARPVLSREGQARVRSPRRATQPIRSPRVHEHVRLGGLHLGARVRVPEQRGVQHADDGHASADASQRDVFSVHDAERFGGDQSQRRDGPHAGVSRLAGDGRRERPRQHDRGRGVRLHRRHERRHDGRLHREDESQAVRKDDARVRRGVGLRQAVGLRRRREVALHPRAELGAGERGGPADANVAVHGSGERVVREQRERAPATHKHDEPRSVRQGRGGVSAHPRSGLLHDLDRASAHTRRDVRGWLRRVVLRRQVRSVRRDARNVSVRRHVRVRGGMVRRRVR